MTVLKRLAIFLLLVFVLDRGLGALLGQLNDRTFSGERGGLTNRALQRDADILVLGSSRAQFHVMPSELERELGGSAYNAGLKGHDLLYSAMLAELWTKRHHAPRAYVLNIDMESLLERADESAAAVLMAPYLDESPRVREVLYALGPFKPIMYASRAYRYNGRVFPILKNLLVGARDAASDGYVAALGTFDPAAAKPRHGMNDVPRGVVPSDQAALEVSRQPYDELKVRLLKQLASDAQRDKSRLFLVHAPIWGLPEKAHANWLRRLNQLVSSLPNTQLFDLCEYTYPETFKGHPELMHDFNHLNETGARLFSALLAKRLKAALEGSSTSPVSHTPETEQATSAAP